MYTFENRCREDSSTFLGDDAVKIVLNTKGAIGEISEELRDLLLYMGGNKPKSDYAKELESAVTETRADKKWRVEYMLLIERDRRSKRVGRYMERIAHVRELRNRYTGDELAERCFVTPQQLPVILEVIDAHPEWDDEEVAEHVDFE